MFKMFWFINYVPVHCKVTWWLSRCQIDFQCQESQILQLTLDVLLLNNLTGLASTSHHCELCPLQSMHNHGYFQHKPAIQKKKINKK